LEGSDDAPLHLRNQGGWKELPAELGAAYSKYLRDSPLDLPKTSGKYANHHLYQVTPKNQGLQ